MPRESLGDLEKSVLLAILHLGDGAYGVAIADEMARRSERVLPRAAIYVALRRLEAKRFVASRLESGRESAGRPRRLVRVTARGRAALTASQRVMNRMWAGLEWLVAES